jgi:pyruvate dehydrogenase E2 component (dihydrolipoamide acetyltransferase)
MADVDLPQLGETVTEGTITRWFKKVGDQVAADEPLFEVSTDKVDTEVPSPVSRVVLEILVPPRATPSTSARGAGRACPIGAADAPRPRRRPPPRARARCPSPSPPSPRRPGPAPERPGPCTEPRPSPARSGRCPAAAPRRSRSGRPAPGRPLPPRSSAGRQPPAVAGGAPPGRREHGINPDDVTGTGPAAASPATTCSTSSTRAGAPRSPRPAPPPRRLPPRPPGRPGPGCRARRAPGPGCPAPLPPPAAASPRRAARRRLRRRRDTTVPLSKIRKLTGEPHGHRSASAHAFSVVEVDFANVDAGAQGEEEPGRPARASASPTCRSSPVPSSTRWPSSRTSTPRRRERAGRAQLRRHRHRRRPRTTRGCSCRWCAGRQQAPAGHRPRDQRSRQPGPTRKLSPDEISGGTFTITNNGSAGSVLTMPIINQPQVAILSTDAIVRKPVVATAARRRRGDRHPPGRQPRDGWDHRAFDGAYAAGFLVKVKQILETRDWSQEL